MRNPTIRKLRIQGGIWVLAEESVSPGSWELGLGLKGAGGVGWGGGGGKWPYKANKGIFRPLTLV